MIRLSDYRVEPYGIPVNGTLSGLAAIGKWIYILSDKELVRMKNTSTSTEVLYTFPPGRAPMRLWADIRTETLYFLDGGVYQFYTGFGATGLPVEVIPLDGRFYGLGVDPANHDIYVADARDFVQPGRILVYNSGFELVRTFESGIVPQHFAFAIE